MTKMSEPRPAAAPSPTDSPGLLRAPPRTKKQSSVPLRVPPRTKKQFTALLRGQKKAVLRAPPCSSADKKRQFSVPLRVPPRTKKQFSAPLRVPPRTKKAVPPALPPQFP